MKIWVAILGREHVAGIETHAERGDVRAQLLRRRAELAARTGVELRVLDVALVAEREAEVEAGLRRVVQRVGRLCVAEPVAAVVGEPELVRLRVPRKADRVGGRRRA